MKGDWQIHPAVKRLATALAWGGVGMAVITAAEDEKEALEVLNSFEGTQAYTIGRIEKGERGVRLW